jgi:hypothetical protein
MNQAVAVLKTTVAGLLAVFTLWHLLGIGKRLASTGGGRKVRRRLPESKGSSFRSGPIDPH